uniref:Uncharacterized protein MANES_11G058500 n=1 Tax=Rhizophora mucronata TaxID=61149 RepID=A0A2P2JGQ2_RHIMU
MPSPSLSL